MNAGSHRRSRFGRGLTAALALVGAVWAAPFPTPTGGLSSPGPVSDEPRYQPPETPPELLRITPEMHDYFARRIPARAPEYDRLSALVDAIVQPDGLNFAYDAEGTFDARETFRLRRGNCASYAFLIVAVARAFDFNAVFQNISRATRWSRVGDVIVSVQHLDVRITTFAGTYIIDLDPVVVESANLEMMEPITDRRAAAEFYCNIGFEEFVHGRLDEALRYTTLGTEVDPTCATAWANRGTLHARRGELAAARLSFERSLRANPRGDTALDGYLAVLRRSADPQDRRRVAKLERRARSLRERNPYYHFQLAQQAHARGDAETADKILRRATSLKDDDPEFYEQRIVILQHLGRASEAERIAKKLERLRSRLASTSAYIVPP